MSYSIHLRGVECVTCKHTPPEPYCPDPTYKLTPIFDFAITGEDMPNPDVTEASAVLLGAKTDRPRGLRLLDGKRAEDTVKMLSNALDRMNDPALNERFVALEPENKWGDLVGAKNVVRSLRDIAIEFPTYVWGVN
jgi:hypothetical protein